jgi:hypothetical protein
VPQKSLHLVNNGISLMLTDIDLKRMFRSSIRRGTGEAYLLINKYPDINFSNEIIKACLKNFAYDGQCESSRAQYLFGLILLCDQRKIRLKVLTAVATEQNDTWSLTQLFDLAKLFAMQGDTEARQLIYDRFYVKPINGSDWVGYTEIVDLDGLDGLLFIADKIGRSLEKNPDDWQDNSIIAYFEQMYPDTDAMAALNEVAEGNPHIRRYLKNVEKTENERIVNPRIPFDNIVDEVLKSKRRFIRKEVSDEELDLLAQRLLTEKSEKDIEKLLFVFTKFKFPLDSRLILDIAKRKSTKNKKLVDLAILALRLITGDEIRAFSLAEANKTKYPASLLRILKSNYSDGDDKILSHFAEIAVNEDDIESLAISYVDIYETNKTAECKQPIEVIYGKLTCAIHRRDLVKILQASNVLSDQIKEEIKFDCDEETRRLAYV